MQLESECILGMMVRKSIYLIRSKDWAEHLRGQTSKISSGGVMVQEIEGFGEDLGSEGLLLRKGYCI